MSSLLTATVVSQDVSSLVPMVWRLATDGSSVVLISDTFVASLELLLRHCPL